MQQQLDQAIAALAEADARGINWPISTTVRRLLLVMQEATLGASNAASL